MSAAQYAKPLPKPNKEDAEFWAGLSEHRFLLPRCLDCGHVWFPPYLNCQRCLSYRREFFDASGHGVVSGVTVIEHPYLKSFADDLPYNVCLIELDEGPLMYSNLVDIANKDIKVNMKVQVVYFDTGAGIVLPKFKPATEGA